MEITTEILTDIIVRSYKSDETKSTKEEMLALKTVNDEVDMFAFLLYDDILKLAQMFSSSKSRGFSAKILEHEADFPVTVMLYFVMGRTLVTIKKDDSNVIAIVGPDNKEETARPGLSSIVCESPEMMSKMMRTVSSRWKSLFNDKHKFIQCRFKKDKNVTLL